MRQYLTWGHFESLKYVAEIIYEEKEASVNTWKQMLQKATTTDEHGMKLSRFHFAEEMIERALTCQRKEETSIASRF